MSVRDARGAPRDRQWIAGVYREYLEDLAPLDTGVFPVLGEVGHRGTDQAAHFLDDPNVFPLVILKGTEPVGFAMVARRAASGPGASEFRMAEFFVVRSQRRLGIGRSAVQLILRRFAGRWEVRQDLRNPGAVSFWRRVVSAYTGGRYQERITDGEVRQVFQSPPPEGSRSG